jgi:hypothetical protein
MKKLIAGLLLLTLAACGNSKLIPVVTMPTPPAEFMIPPGELSPIVQAPLNDT